MMALVLIVMGIIAASALAELGIRTPGAWAWFGTGIAMIVVQWYRTRQA
jgi:bacteriorhodopsin